MANSSVVLTSLAVMPVQSRQRHIDLRSRVDRACHIRQRFGADCSAVGRGDHHPIFAGDAEDIGIGVVEPGRAEPIRPYRPVEHGAQRR
jgi:hypothetical protein